MDNQKIYDTKLNNRNSSILSFLEARGPRPSRKYSNSSAITDIDNPVSTCLPNYRFEFLSYSITDHVEYSVVLHEEFRVFKRVRSNKYLFKTRYSLLEALDQKVQGKGFPGKKFFGSRDPAFLEKRKKQLEDYLNQLGMRKSKQFLLFVKQIRDLHFNKSLKEPFTLEGPTNDRQ